MVNSSKRSVFGKLMALGGAALAAGAAGSAFAQAPSAQGMGRPGAHGGHGEQGGAGRWGGRMNPEHMERMVERRVSHMLDAVQATPEQRQKIMGIAKAAFKDLQPMREQRKGSREKGMAMLTGANVDRAGLEQLRQEQMRLQDAMGKRKLAAMMDTFGALSPAQRAQVAQRRAAMKGGPGGHGGMGERMRERMGGSMGSGMRPPAGSAVQK